MPIILTVAQPLTGTRAPQARAPEAAPAPPLRLAAAVLAVALMPFPIVLHGWGNPKLPYDYLTILFPVDLAFAAVLVTGAGPGLRRARAGRAGAGTVLLAALAAVMSVAWAAHPSLRGAHTVFELWGSAVLTATLAEALEEAASFVIIGALAAVAVLEAMWAVAQLVTGSGLGLTRLGEDAHPLWPFSASVVAPMGSMVHPYVLAGLGLVVAGVLAGRSVRAERPAPWLLAAAAAVSPVGFTFSRAGLLGAALLIGAYAVAALLPRSPRARCAAAAAVLCVGVAVPAAVWNGGWRDRATQTTSATSANQLTTDRGQLAHEALDLLRSQPFVGVGAGRYVPAAKAHFRHEQDRRVPNFRPVHNVVLLVGAEGGALALLVALALFAAVGWRALRTGPLAVGLYLAYLPFCMLDHFAYSFPQGLVITAAWLAALDTAYRHRVALPA